MVKLSFDALIQKILQYKKETKQNRLYASLPKSFQFPSEQTKICFVVVLFEKCGYKSSIENIIEFKKKTTTTAKKKNDNDTQTNKGYFLNIFPSIECYAHVQFDGVLTGNWTGKKPTDEFSASC